MKLTPPDPHDAPVQCGSGHRCTAPCWSAAAIALGILTSLLAGCGYTHQPLFDTSYRTVSVPVFDNRSFYRGVEFDLTEALKKEIELRTPYKVVNDQTGDTLLTGTIVSVNQRRLSRNREAGLAQELELQLTLDVEWKDQRTGQTIMDRQGLVAASGYIAAQPVGEPLAIGQHQAVQRMAQTLVGAMQKQW